MLNLTFRLLDPYQVGSGSSTLCPTSLGSSYISSHTIVLSVNGGGEQVIATSDRRPTRVCY
jgi:hypothetical protein